MRSANQSVIEACMVAIHETSAGFLEIIGHGWVSIRRGNILAGDCTGLPQYLLMRAHWEQTGF